MILAEAILITQSIDDVVLNSAPIRPEWIESGDPRAANAVVGTSSDGVGVALVWECTPGRFTWRYDYDELIHFVSGSVLIACEGQTPKRYQAGDIVFFRKGDVATWTVEQTVRKVAYCQRPMPRIFGFAFTTARDIVHRLRGIRGSGAKSSATQDFGGGLAPRKL